MQLGKKSIVINEEDKTRFLQSIYRPYLQSVIDHINARMGSTDLISAMSVFDPNHLPDSEDKLPDYGMDKILELTDFYGAVQKVQYDGQEGISQPDIEADGTQAIQEVLSKLIGQGDIATAFPNLSRLTGSISVLLFTTCTVERTFSSIKTRLRNRMGEDTLNNTMRICIEDSSTLPH